MLSKSLFLTALAWSSTQASPIVEPEVHPALEKRATTLIPTSALSSTSAFTQYFSYNYPWGNTHNGAAKMSSAGVVVNGGTLTMTAKYTGPQSGNTAIKYNSGTVYGKNHIDMTKGGSVDFQATFVAPVAKGTWPAFWLTATKGWPPEIDIAEWKGSGKISFNTFNTSSQVKAMDVAYSNPTAQHTIRGEMRDLNGKDVGFTFYMDGKKITTQVGKGYIGQSMWLILDLQMEGSSGSPGPKTDTVWKISNLSVVRNS